MRTSHCELTIVPARLWPTSRQLPIPSMAAARNSRRTSSPAMTMPQTKSQYDQRPSRSVPASRASSGPPVPCCSRTRSLTASVTALGCDSEITSASGGTEPGAYPSVLRAMRSYTLRCTFGLTQPLHRLGPDAIVVQRDLGGQSGLVPVSDLVDRFVELEDVRAAALDRRVASAVSTDDAVLLHRPLPSAACRTLGPVHTRTLSNALA